MITTQKLAVLSLALGGIAAAVAVLAQSQQLDTILVIEQPVDHDLYAARREVNIRSSIDGDLVAAGAVVTVDGEVAGDIIVAAQDINIRSAVSDDIRAVGQDVRVTSPVSGHVVAAGQSVTIEQTVGDWAWLAGTTVEVLGDIGGELKIRANKITINAEVAGDVDLIGDELDIGPKAVVSGNVTWRSDNKANISADAQIEGEFIEEPLPGLVEELRSGDGYSLPLNLIVAVIVLFFLFSRPLRATAERIATRPGGSLLIGFLVFFATPSLAIFLLFTGVGVWLGLVLIFVFFVLLLLGVLAGLFAASDMALRRFRPHPVVWQSLAAIFVTVVAVGLIARVPWLGFIVVMAIWLIGLGALCWNAWATLRSVGQEGRQTS